MKKLLIINGPNLNLLGRRQPDIYGTATMEEILADTRFALAGMAEIEYFQSNCEGEIIDRLHAAGFGDTDGIIINAGAYTHTSLAIADAIAAIEAPVVEVHLSNVAAREAERRVSLVAPVCRGSISGFGGDVYRLAALALTGHQK
ncbi:MAG: type II 3-dehydroquinate dehydratase [Muribaculaceae bacterium]|nr:type II 3-dehydroquinate dehydratase [Muribaculaceae bacterium]